MTMDMKTDSNDDLNKRTEINREIFKYKLCPFVNSVCIKEKCWCYTGGPTYWTEQERVEVPIPNSTKKSVKFVPTNKVFRGEVAGCRQDVYQDHFILTMEEAPSDFKIDSFGNVVCPDGVLVRDKTEEEIHRMFIDDDLNGIL